MLDTNEYQENEYKSEIYPFKSETSQLMKLIVNSFYSNKDIFLRELISNCSDSLNKFRQSKLSNNDSIEEEPLKIRIKPNKNKGILSISDNGIGMTKEELIKDIGTIAKSGTFKYIQELKNNSKKKQNLIGHFGVGFYSVFLVADRVQIITRSYLNNQNTWLWESDSMGQFKIVKLPNNDIKRGCTVNLYLKDNDLNYLDEFKLRDIIKRHTQFINYKVEILVRKNINLEKDKGGFLNSQSSNNKDYTYNWETVISEQPIWEKKTNENCDSDYNSFYKTITNDTLNPLKHKHFSMEGKASFKAVIFIPSTCSEDIFSPQKDKMRLKLYSNRVFIMDNCEDLVPEWLNFIRGVVDSPEIPLNVSREILQENGIIKVINKVITLKTIELIQEIYQDKKLKESFYSSFSKSIKYAIYKSQDYKNKMSQFLQYYTSTSGDQLRTLEQYITNLKPGQKYIYYITGESLQSVKESIFLEIFIFHKVEVIFMTDTIDEYMLQSFSQYQDFELISIYQPKIEDFLPIIQKTEPEQTYSHVLSLFKETLYPNVKNVIISSRLTHSPACIVSTKDGWTPNMERIMKAQALGGEEYKDYIGNQKVMEINLQHPLIIKIHNLLEAEKTFDLKKNILMIYKISCLLSGFTVDSIFELSQNLYNNLNKELNRGEL